ncbi:MAG: MFS transporter [Candidatus Hodarchaeota archaeon]
MESNTRDRDNSEVLHPRWVGISIGFNEFTFQVIGSIATTNIFYFYEVEIGLNTWLITLAISAFTIWNAINDPLIGHFCDRPFFFTKRWGRRFPWIIIFIFPAIIFYALVFTPPSYDGVKDQWIIFVWLLLSLLIRDTLSSFATVNADALFPEKFRNENERRTVSGYINIIMYLGFVIGFVIPSLIIEYGEPQSFTTMIWIMTFIVLIAGILGIPGVKDDKETISRYLTGYEEAKLKNTTQPFFKLFITAFKSKNFAVFIFLFFSYSVLRACLLNSAQYGIRFILKMPPEINIILMGGNLIGSIITIPIWVKLMKKINDNRKVMIIAAVIFTISAIPMTFLEDVIGWTAALFFSGIGIAGMFVAKTPLFANVIDESVLNTGTRNEGIFNGFYVFALSFSGIIQSLIFAIVHELTGFVEGAETQSPLAIIGIHISMALIPSLIVLVATVAFWKFYDLTPEKLNKVKNELKRLNL